MVNRVSATHRYTTEERILAPKRGATLRLSTNLRCFIRRQLQREFDEFMLSFSGQNFPSSLKATATAAARHSQRRFTQT